MKNNEASNALSEADIASLLSSKLLKNRFEHASNLCRFHRTPMAEYEERNEIVIPQEYFGLPEGILFNSVAFNPLATEEGTLLDATPIIFPFTKQATLYVCKASPPPIDLTALHWNPKTNEISQFHALLDNGHAATVFTHHYLRAINAHYLYDQLSWTDISQPDVLEEIAADRKISLHDLYVWMNGKKFIIPVNNTFEIRSFLGERFIYPSPGSYRT
jgi:hypothetical protein